MIRLEDSESDEIREYKTTLLVATCGNCRDARKKYREKLQRELIFCPDCNHVLFWERITEEMLATDGKRKRFASRKEERKFSIYH